ncbi:hypothetical protein BDAP_002385 [Binucleata daphniae]
MRNLYVEDNIIKKQAHTKSVDFDDKNMCDDSKMHKEKAMSRYFAVNHNRNINNYNHNTYKQQNFTGSFNNINKDCYDLSQNNHLSYIMQHITNSNVPKHNLSGNCDYKYYGQVNDNTLNAMSNHPKQAEKKYSKQDEQQNDDNCGHFMAHSVVNTISKLQSNSSNVGVFDKDEINIDEKVCKRKQYKKRKQIEKVDDLFNYKKYKENIAKICTKIQNNEKTKKETKNTIKKQNHKIVDIYQNMSKDMTKNTDDIARNAFYTAQKNQNGPTNYIKNESKRNYNAILNGSYQDNLEEDENNYINEYNGISNVQNCKQSTNHSIIDYKKTQLQKNPLNFGDNKQMEYEKNKLLYLNDAMMKIPSFDGTNDHLETISYSNRILEHLNDFINNKKTNECTENETYIEVLNTHTTKPNENKSYEVFVKVQPNIFVNSRKISTKDIFFEAQNLVYCKIDPKSEMANLQSTKNEIVKCTKNRLDYDNDGVKYTKRMKKNKTPKKKLADITNIQSTKGKNKIENFEDDLNTDINETQKVETYLDAINNEKTIKLDNFENNYILKSKQHTNETNANLEVLFQENYVTNAKDETKQKELLENDTIENNETKENELLETKENELLENELLENETIENIETIKNKDTCMPEIKQPETRFFDNAEENKLTIANKYFFDDLSDTIDNFGETGNNKICVLKEIECYKKSTKKIKKNRKRKSCKNEIVLKKETKRNTKINNGYKNVRIIYSNRLFFNENNNVEIKPGRRLKFVEYNEENMERVENNLIECKNVGKCKKHKTKKKDIVVLKMLKKINFANDFLYNSGKK